jgi:hypothetical protein
VVAAPKSAFSADFAFRLLFALFLKGKCTKKLMKIYALYLLIISTQIMCITGGESADLLRNPRKETCAKACGIPAGNWWISGGTHAEKKLSPIADPAV